MPHDIWQLTAADIEEYRAAGYDADHLGVGDCVWDDGELFVTADELQQRIGERDAALQAGEWPESWRQELETLRDALQRLQGARRA
ncbi:hypothetical protein D3C78_463740 [compost metagenome]